LVCQFVFLLLPERGRSYSIKGVHAGYHNGQAFGAVNFVVARATSTTSINGTLGPASNAESIGISIMNAKVGSFSLSENTDYLAVYKSTTDEYMSASGTVQIISMTAEWIEGKFSFEAHSTDDPAAQVTVGDGESLECGWSEKNQIKDA
jgi:hypothetical protein